MMKKFIFPLLLCLLLCSCYDATEVDDLAYVVALGIDKGEEKKMKVTFQYAVPLNISGGVDSKGGESAPLFSATFETDAIHLATDIANDKMAKITDLSHLKLIVFSEEIAKDGITEFRRDLKEDFEIRPDTSLAVCQGSALECLEAVSSPLELNPSRFYEDFFANTASVYSFSQDISDFLNGKTEFPMPYLIYEDALEAYGMAIMKNDRLQALYFPQDTVIYNILRNTFTNLKFETKQGVFRLDSRLPPSIKIETLDKPKITFFLSLTGEAVAGEETLFSDSKKAEQILTQTLQKRILNFLYKTQKTDCDILDLYKHARKNFFTEQGFINYNWNEKYKDAEFFVQISFQNTRVQ